MLSTGHYAKLTGQRSVGIPEENGMAVVILRRYPVEDGAISGFGGQKSVPEQF